MDPRRYLIAAFLLAAAVPGQAGVYKWVDENGKVTYTDAPPPGAAGKSAAVEEKISVMGMDPAIRAAAERRFAMETEADERDWQRRQQAMVAQHAAQAAQPAAPVESTIDSYYPAYYTPYYRAAYYPASYLRGPSHGRVINKVPPRIHRHSLRVAQHSLRASGPSRSAPAARGPGPGSR